jgi:Spy/CpxP family protein refolding chaperone
LIFDIYQYQNFSSQIKPFSKSNIIVANKLLKSFDMKKLSLVLGILIITSLTALNAQRGPRFNNQDDTNGYKGQRECRIPDLTEDQQSKIDEMRTAHWTEMKTLRADLGILKAEMQKLKVADKPDQNAIDGKIKEMGALKTKMAIAANHHHLAVRELLTDEQKAYFDRTNRGPKMGEFGRGHGRGHRGQGYHRGGGRGCGSGNGQGYRNGSCRY